jgi:hypothetical protein
MLGKIFSEHLMKLREISRAALRQSLDEHLAIPKYEAGRCLQWGRKATDTAIASGTLPVIGTGQSQRVATEWLKRKLDLLKTEGK